MSRHLNLHSGYVADGFADDCDELIHRCMQVNTLSYEKFCNVWKDMEFAMVFHGRTSSAELAELSEEVLHISKRYMVANTSNFEESVAGLFLVFALLNLQPFKNFAALRLVEDDVPAIERIELVARRARRYDVLYILGAVLIRGPCQYHVAARERGMEHPIKKYLEGHASIDKQGVRPKGVFYRQSEELDIIKELNGLEKLYKESKAAISGTGKIERSLSYVNHSLAGELDASLKKIIAGLIDDDDDDGDDDNEEEHSPRTGNDTAQSIKDRAMKTSVKPMKHLTGIKERNIEEMSPERKKSSKSKSPSKTSKLQRKTSPTKKNISPCKNKPSSILNNSPPEENKPSPTKNMPSQSKNTSSPTKNMPSHSKNTSSPTKNMPSDSKNTSSPEKNTALKRKGLNTSSGHKRKRKRKLKIMYESSDEDDEMSISNSDDDNLDVISDEPSINKEKEKTQEHEIDIKIDTLPIIIRSESDGQYYEIEIIDNYNKNHEKTSTKPEKSIIESVTKNQSEIKKKFLSLENVSIVKVGETSKAVSEIPDTADMAEISTVGEKVFKKPQNLPIPGMKRETRDLKKPRIKAKFQRMGMLSVANFKDEESSLK